MGIVNITPDSFSGDGMLGDAAIDYAEALVRQGADMLDLGAESTRPGAEPLDAETEWSRLGPVLRVLAHAPWRDTVRIGVDTRHAQTVRRACALGVRTINDVSGLSSPGMADALREQSCDCVVMHALSLPADPARTLPPECDPVAEIIHWKTQITAQARVAGIAPERLIYDPGIGFGKTPAQSLALLLHASTLVQSGGRWLVGHSRKSFLTLFDDAPAGERDGLTRAFSIMLASAHIDYLRVHDIAGHVALFDRLCT